MAEIFAPDGVGVSDPSELLRPFGDHLQERTALLHVLNSLPGFTVSMGGLTTGKFKVSKGMEVLKPDILLGYQ